MMDDSITTRHYIKERYTCRLWVKEYRFWALRTKDEEVRETRRIVDVMTRWLRRCVRDQPVVIGSARVRKDEDMPTARRYLVATAPAFRDVHPDDRAVLEIWIDKNEWISVVVPVRSDPPLDSESLGYRV